MLKHANRAPLAGATLLVSMLVGCGSGGATPQGCGADGASDGCAPDGRCLAGACVANAAPIAAFAVQAGLKALALAQLDGSTSSDPDAAYGDAVEAWEWTITTAGAPCDPPVVKGTGKVAQVRFGCAGRYLVQLAVKDQLGKASEPVTQEVEVAEGSSLVQLGADQVVDHRCAGTSPAVCTPDGTDPTVSATLGVTPVGTPRYAWRALAPAGGELGTVRSVSFPAGAPSGSTKVHIETQGYLIVDDWPIEVEASDDAGPLGTARMRISVGNRPPRVKSAAPTASVDHSYSAGAYRAQAPGAAFEDPDGDALTGQPTGSTLCPSFTVDESSRAQIVCQLAFDGTNLGLSGFVGTHAVAQVAKDPWGAASSSTTTAVTLLDRPVTATSTTATARRTCQETTCCYVEPGTSGCDMYTVACPATTVAQPLGISDPDGDPVTVTWTSGSMTTPAKPCLPGSCAATLTVPQKSSCGPGSLTSASGTFSATDGLAPSGSATMTIRY